MKKIVILTGAGMSAESGIKTFRDAGGLWENYPVEQVASHDGWLANPVLVNSFYNARRKELISCQPNEKEHEVTVITQNVDDLHERAGSSKVIHLHGELMKVCSSRDVENPACWQTLTSDNYEVLPGAKASDGSLLRPYIVFFGEAVPMIEQAAAFTLQADIFVIIGTSLNVYPAAGLVRYVKEGAPIYLIDPKPVKVPEGSSITYIQKGASEGMKELMNLLNSK